MSAAQWLDSLDLQPEARQLVSMLVRTATYVDPDAMPISADAAVRQLQMAIAEGVRYIDGGWQTMIDALLAVCRAQGVEVQTKTTALSVIENGGPRRGHHLDRDVERGRGDHRERRTRRRCRSARERPGLG